MQKIFSLILLVAFGQVNTHNPCEGLHLVFVNDYAGCSRYFSCLNSFPHPVECSEGRHFNADPLGCFPPGQYDCDPCPSEGIFAFGIEDSCTDYRLCINGNVLERVCAPGTHFDRREGRCVQQELAQCDYLRCPPTGNKIVADPSNCSRYLVCVDGEEVANRECADGLLFDPSLGSCARAETVQCPFFNGISSFIGTNPGTRQLVGDVPTVGIAIPTAPTARPLP